LLDFEQILLVKRGEGNLGLPQNWQGNSSLDRHIASEIAKLAFKREKAAGRKTLPARGKLFCRRPRLAF
jgi:hypothetical protein